MVLTLRYTLLKFFVGVLLTATVHSCLNNQLLISLGHSYFSTVLSFHNFPANYVGSYIFFSESFSTSCLEMALRKLLFFQNLLLPKFFLNLSLNFFLEQLSFAAYFWQIISRILTSTPGSRWRIGGWILDFSIDSVSSVIELFGSINRIFKIKVSLWNMFFHYSSTKSKLLKLSQKMSYNLSKTRIDRKEFDIDFCLN